MMARWQRSLQPYLHQALSFLLLDHLQEVTRCPRPRQFERNPRGVEEVETRCQHSKSRIDLELLPEGMLK